MKSLLLSLLLLAIAAIGVSQASALPASSIIAEAAHDSEAHNRALRSESSIAYSRAEYSNCIENGFSFFFTGQFDSASRFYCVIVAFWPEGNATHQSKFVKPTDKGKTITCHFGKGIAVDSGYVPDTVSLWNVTVMDVIELSGNVTSSVAGYAPGSASLDVTSCDKPWILAVIITAGTVGGIAFVGGLSYLVYRYEIRQGPLEEKEVLTLGSERTPILTAATHP